MAPVKRKIVLTKETTDTKIQKRPRTRTCRKKNENSTTTLLEELASEAVSSSQVGAEFSQKEYEEREKEKNEVDDDGERAKEVEEEEGNTKEVEEDKGKQNEVEEEEGKNKEIVEEEEEQINEVDEDKGKQKEVEEQEQEKNEVEDDGIKTINAHTFSMHLQPNATGDSIMRSAMGKPFDTFRITLKQNGLEDFFRNSCFGHFLDLLENNNARFQLTMVYALLKRRFIFQNPEKNDEVLINYCGMPLFVGKREFVIVSGLKCHPPSEPVPEFIVNKEPQEERKEEKMKQHSQLRSRYTKEAQRVIVRTLDSEAFNNYPWSHENFELTVKYLLKPLGPKTNNLFGFPWAFMAWAFEVIPHLSHQVNAEEEISSPMILRWLRSKTKTSKNIPDLYNLHHDAVVHPWLVPTEKELQTSYLITLGLVETLFDFVVDRVKMELVGARTIKRDRVVNELVVFYGGDSRGIDASAGVGAGQNQGATSCRRCSGILCEKCKKQDEDSIMYLQTLSQAAKRRKKSLIKAIQNLKKKIFVELPIAVGVEVLEFKHVNVYKRVTIAEKNKLVDLARAKNLRAEYGMHCFRGKDFRIMTSMDIWERHVRYPEYYDSTDRILDLNFYSNFKLRYDKMSEETTTVGGRSFTQLINEFEWDEDMINYVRGIRPYPGGMDWIGAKKLLEVMNINKTHFVTLEILLHEYRMNVYDCLLLGMEHAKFLTFTQPVFELLPKLLKQSGIMKHLPDKFLNEPLEFKGRLEPMVTNDSKAACTSYSLAFIEHLITKTTIQPPKIMLCDNAVHRM
ncbi:hypothetical protein KY290_012273 [Solanum tuberosum]|uniref:Ubiquitin-like protease family profile domain-containing protein n=1 Tax=Solanum tuberosum TaxID=4113 RepID=A0ABQ7W2Z9_SOLTU|nr:hypothetical protein KY290_012273 [Solanum tuberosum]